MSEESAHVPLAEPVLSIRGLVRSYPVANGRLEVLRGVDLDVSAGELVGLIGPSGSGKSSLLHAAGLLEHPDQGRIVIAGQECGQLQEHERTRLRLDELGFVYQFHHLLPEFSALDNVALPMRIAGAPLADARARAMTLLQQLGIDQRADHQPAQMSGGEQQRVAVARALANRPKLVLADEPTGNLDRKNSREALKLIRETCQENGAALLLVSHDPEVLSTFEDVQDFADLNQVLKGSAA